MIRRRLRSALCFIALITAGGVRAQDCTTGVPDFAGSLQLSAGPGGRETVRIKNPIPVSVAKSTTAEKEKILAKAKAETPSRTPDVVGDGKPVNVRVCWLSEDQVLRGLKCSDLNLDGLAPEKEVAEVPFEIGVCEKNKQPQETLARLGFDTKRFEAADALVFVYEPTVTSQTTSYFGVQWDEEITAREVPPVVTPPAVTPPAVTPPAVTPPPVTPPAVTPPPVTPPALVTPVTPPPPPAPLLVPRFQVIKLIGSAAAPRFDEDSRYKLWIYTGYSYFRSAHDFKDGYPELRARFETRITDERIAMQKRHPALYEEIRRTGRRCYAKKQNGQVLKNADGDDLMNCGGRPWFGITRLYGEVGLTGVDVEATSATTTQPANRTRQTFDGSFAVGLGKTLLVTPMQENTDTNAFSFQGILRLGVLTIPGKDAGVDVEGNATSEVPGAQAYSYSLGGRIENEGGHFQGAYFELGIGQSEKFNLKQVPRLRADALLPITAPGDFYRLATRVQIDLPRPFAKAKGEGLEAGRNLEGEIRISLLLNIDILELTKRLGGTPPTTAR